MFGPTSQRSRGSNFQRLDVEIQHRDIEIQRRDVLESANSNIAMLRSKIVTLPGQAQNYFAKVATLGSNVATLQRADISTFPKHRDVGMS